MRNVGGLRTFNPKLKDSAGGEVNEANARSIIFRDIWNIYDLYGRTHEIDVFKKQMHQFEITFNELHIYAPVN